MTIRSFKLPLSAILMTLAVLAGGIVRFWRISSLPFPPNGDELFFGYYGWSLLHFLTDEFGNFLPLSFVSIGDFKYPGLAYLNMIPALFFGLSEITARFWAVVSGIVLIPLIYILAKLIWENMVIALSAAWLVALSPWSITLSRMGYENHIAVVFSTAAIVCLVWVLKRGALKRRRVFLISAFVLFLIASFTYAAQRFFIPAILGVGLMLSFIGDSPFRKIRKIMLVFFIGISLVIALSLVPPGSRGRAAQVAWTLDGTQFNRLQEIIVEAGTSPVKVPVLMTHLLHNRKQISVISFFERFANHLSPKFLFFEGEAASERIPDMGLLLWVELLLLPVGLVTLLSSRAKHFSLFILGWIVLAPIPSALTLGEPHINRASIMIPPLALISGYGFWQIVNLFKNKVKIAAIIFLSAGIFISSIYTLNQIFVQKPVNKPWFREQVNKEMVETVYKLKDKYKAVVISKDEFIFFLFYQKISPGEFINNADILPLSGGLAWDRVKRLDNIYFKMPFDCPKGGKLNVLYVCYGGNIPQNSRILSTIYYLDGVPAYTLLEFYPLSKKPSSLPPLSKGLQYMVDVETSKDFPDGIIPDSYPSFW